MTLSRPPSEEGQSFQEMVLRKLDILISPIMKLDPYLRSAAKKSNNNYKWIQDLNIKSKKK
jgi:hypothetical protein